MTLPVFLDPRYHDAVILDLDGVVADTAAIHAAAWKAVFDDFFACRTASRPEDHREFTQDDYRKFIGGSSGRCGAAEFLASRGISIPLGTENDTDAHTFNGLMHRLQQICMKMLVPGVRVFDSTVEFVRQLHAAEIATAVFSSSLNCAGLLSAAGLSELFAVRADAAVLSEAATRLGVPPQRCVIVVDTAAAVAAGRQCGFGMLIGVERAGNGRALLASGADSVVPDLVSITVRQGYRRLSAMADALESYSLIGPLAEARQPAVLLDFDGTLSEIVSDPGAATLLSGAAETLVSLAVCCPVAVISGRSLEDIRTRVGIPGVWYAGSHGFELMSPDGSRHHNDAGAKAVRNLADATSELRTALADIEGLTIEDKRFSVAVHYRNIPPDNVDAVVAAVRSAGQRHKLRVTGGRKVIELRPDVDWDKGKTIELILERIDGADPLLPIYIGDDATDEDAFDAIRHKGIGVAVRAAESGDRRSAARFTLDGPTSVCQFLTRLTNQLAAQQETANDAWTMTFGGYRQSDEKLREALCTTGNGYMAVRGAAPECAAGEFHYPAFYVAGVYNRLTDEVAGKTIDNESLVNLPNWLPLTFRIDGGPWFDIDDVDVTSYLVTLDLRRATLTRDLTFTDRAGRTTRLVQNRFVAMHLPHVGALQTTVHARDWAGRLEFRSMLDGDVANRGVKRYRNLASRHVQIINLRELSEDSVLLAVSTVESMIVIAVAQRTTVHADHVDGALPRRLISDSYRVGHEFDVDIGAGQSVTVDKMVTVFTNRDHGISSPITAAERELDRVGEYSAVTRGIGWHGRICGSGSTSK